MADEPQVADPLADESTITAAELMSMTREERAELGFRTVRDPENLPAEMLERAQARMDEVIRRDRERDARRHAS